MMQRTLGERLKALRKERGMTLDELSRLVPVSRQTLSRYETGVIGGIPSERVEMLARVLGTTPAYLMGWVERGEAPANLQPMPETELRPLIGKIACGTPITAVENVEEQVPVPAFLRCDFVVRCSGDSMVEARIFDGDLVYVRQQDDVENGEIAVVLIDDQGESSATLKRIYKGEDQVTLAPANPAYAPLVFVGESARKVRILGKAVAFTSSVR